MNYTTMNYTTNYPPDPADIIQEIVQAPTYLSHEYIQDEVIPPIYNTVLGVTAVYFLVFYLGASRLIPQEDESDKGPPKRRKLAYQMTNGLVNAGLGLMGLYYQYHVLPESASTEQRIEGLEDLTIIGAAQIGYQIWSIIIGFFWVNEPPTMLIHHAAVIMASIKGTFMTNGFRYYAPLSLGIIELSSVPLSVMNAFKDNDAWREANPQAYMASRMLFAVAFLVIRIAYFVPQHVEYLWLSFMVNYFADTEHVGLLYRAYMGTAFVGSLFLLVLQLYWGYLIVNGLSRVLMPKMEVKSHILEKKTL